jgi:hypothetical protein
MFHVMVAVQEVDDPRACQQHADDVDTWDKEDEHVVAAVAAARWGQKHAEKDTA